MKNGQKGFTLIEVAIAFAVLALVSGTLLQMFIVSAKVNHQAYEIDKANALAVKIQEVFKENPGQVDVIAELVGATKSTNATTTAISAYLDKNWQATATTATAFYQVDLVVATTGTSVLENSGYFPANGEIWNLTADTVYNLQIVQNTSNSGLLVVQLPNGLPAQQINIAVGTPIIIGNNGTPIVNHTDITISNNSDIPVDIYVLDAATTTSVSIIVAQGICNYSILPSRSVEIKNQLIQLIINRMSDGMLLATSTGSAYGSTHP
ncbi:MAG: prepilin-type N-terminal cleavage/methylation domain-containing protein [Clostridia bacterium]